MTQSEIVSLIKNSPKATFDIDKGDDEILKDLKLSVGTDIDPNDTDTLNPLYIDVLRDSKGTVHYLSDIVEVKISEKK